MNPPKQNGKSSRRRISSGSSDADRFSNLPDDIIHYIFSFLETIDVIRNREVSRKWRSLWLSMPYFNLNIRTARLDPRDFKDFVNWVLLSQFGQVDIQRFRLRCIYDSTFYRWISVLARRNLHELHLKLASSTPVELPHCLVTCESLNLLTLRLTRLCVLKLPSFSGFRRLKSFNLYKVEFLDHILFSNFISSFPLLENLIMGDCTFRHFKILHIASSSLKNLTILDLQFGEHLIDGMFFSKVVRIDCSSLVCLNLTSEEPWDLFIHFQDLNSLNNALISLESDVYFEKNLPPQSCLKALCNTKALKLSESFLEVLDIVLPKPDCLYNTFYNLKSLTLYAGMRSRCVQWIINLLSYTPYLEALTIYFEWDHDLSDYWKIPDVAISCLTNHLKTVELLDVEGIDIELELVRFLLQNGHVLQKMSIITWPPPDNYICRDIIPEVMKLPKSSPNVVLTTLKDKKSDGFYKLFA